MFSTGLAKGPPKFKLVWENIILVYLAVSDKALDPVALLTLEANLILKPKSQAHSEKKGFLINQNKILATCIDSLFSRKIYYETLRSASHASMAPWNPICNTFCLAINKEYWDLLLRLENFTLVNKSSY